MTCKLTRYAALPLWGLMLALVPISAAQATKPAATAPAGPAAAAAEARKVDLKLSVVKEEGKQMVQALVTADGKPLEKATVAFFVRRTFGEMTLGEDQTLDDGTAAVPFPEGLPGGATGQLELIARVKAPAEYASAVAHSTVGGGTIVRPQPDPFPRALWSPRAPLPLLITILTLLGGVWMTYSFVLVQLWKIRRSDPRNPQ